MGSAQGNRHGNSGSRTRQLEERDTAASTVANWESKAEAVWLNG